MDRLESDQENFRAALTWASDSASTELMLRLAASLAAYWSVRGPFTDGRRWLERSLRSAASAPVVLRARAASGLGTMLWSLSEFAEAATWHQVALEWYSEADDIPGQAFSIYNLGVQAFQKGEYGRAAALFERSEGQYRAMNDCWSLATTLLAHGVVALEQGENRLARTLCEQSLNHFRAVGDLRTAGIALNNLGEIARRQQDDRRAAAMYDQALSLARTLDDLPNVAMALHNLAQIALKRGRAHEAARFFKEGLDVARQLREKRVLAMCVAGLGAVACALGRLSEAARLLGCAETSIENLGVSFDSLDRAVYNRTVATVRRGLGTSEMAFEVAIGRTLALEQVLEMAESLAKPPARGAGRAAGNLSAREREVVALVVRGFTNRQIADALVISERTAGIHIQHVFDKLGFNTRAQVAAWVVRQELVPGLLTR